MDSVKTKINITDNPSKVPVKLSKCVHTNIHLVSSTPMNPLKRAKFFDESNQFGSPIRRGSSTDVNSNSPNKNNNKIPENPLNKNPKMLNNEEQTVGTSPFPYYTKLSIKKMTICASEDDSDDDMFVTSKNKKSEPNKLLDDVQTESSDDDTDEEYNSLIIEKSSKTAAIVEPIKKKNYNDDKINIITTKNLSKTNLSTSNYENKENEDIEKNTKIQQKNDKTNKIDKNKTDLIPSPKRKKLNEVQNTKTNKIETDIIDVNNEKENSKKTAKTAKVIASNDDTKQQTRKKQISENGVRKSSRSCQPAVPYWISPWSVNANTTQNNTHILKRTSSEKVHSSILSVKEPKRPKTVPETTKKINRETKLENSFTELVKSTNKKEIRPKSPSKKRTITETADFTQTLNTSKTKINSNKSDTETVSELINQTKKKDNEKNIELPRTTKTNKIDKNETITKTKNQPKKKENDNDKIKTKINDVDKKEKNIPNNETVTKPKKQPKEKENDKNTTLIDEVANTTKTLKKAKTNTAEIVKSVESKDDENNIEIVLNEPSNITRSQTKEILDKENKEKKKKIDNIKLISASPTKNKPKDALNQSVLQEEAFSSETENDVVRAASRKDTSINSRNKSKRENVGKLFTQTFEVASPPRTSKRLKTKKIDSYKETSNIVYTPAPVLNHNLDDVLPLKKSSTASTKNKINNRPLKSRKQTNDLNELENSFQSEESNSETSKESGPSRLKRRTVEKSQKRIKVRGNKTLTPRYIRKSSHKNPKPSIKTRNKQVNFNFNNSEIENSFESDTLSPYENSSRPLRNSSRNLFSQSRTRYSRKNSFYKPDSTDALYKSSIGRYKYRHNDSTLEDTDSLSSEEFYIPETKKRKYMFRGEHKKNKENRSVLHFKERALAAQVPAVTRTLTEIQHHGKSMMMECFGNFPNAMTKVNENSALRGICFMNNFFASGVMEIKLGKVKSCKGSKNHTYFVVLDGIAEFGIANSTKIMRIGDCCVVPKHTFYYISNVSSEINLLVNFLKISL